MTWLVRGLLASVLVGGVVAQEDFRAAYSNAEKVRASGASAEDIRNAYAIAADAYLRLPEATQNHVGWLPSGAFAALLGERFDLASDLFARSMRAGNRDAFHAEHLLKAHLQAERYDDLLRWARDLEGRFSESVWRVLVTGRGLYTAEAWVVAGRWLQAGETEAALWVLRLLVEASEEHPSSIANLALALRQSGQERESEQEYRRALDAAPRDALIWNDFGLLLKGAGRTTDALEAFVKSRERDDTGSGPATTNLVLLGLKVDERFPDETISAISDVVAARPDGALARRACLDALVREFRFPRSEPDTPESGR